MKKEIILFILFCFVVLPRGKADTIHISSLKELNKYAAESNHTIVMKAGLYKLEDYLIEDTIAFRLERKYYQYITFSGNNNKFIMDDVEIIVNTELRKRMKHPIHTNEFIVAGDNNGFRGLKITCSGNGTSPGGALLEVSGNGNVIRNFTLWVQGSFPYGYGDLFGKGGPDVIRHHKHSGFLITGKNIKVYGCHLYMRSFGHGYFIQKDARDIYFEDCVVEGEIRTTDDVLKETSGPAYDVDFRTWTPNREGKYIVTPGYTKSLCEDGFRTYGQNANITFINCTAKNTRGGFELRTKKGVYLENCTTIGTERAYWVNDNAVVKNCKGDANYGPLLFVEGNNIQVELEVSANESECIVHALATIQGANNRITLRNPEGNKRSKAIPILIGYTHPEHGESMSPYGQAPCTDLNLINDTDMPVVMGKEATNCTITSEEIMNENIIK